MKSVYTLIFIILMTSSFSFAKWEGRQCYEDTFSNFQVSSDLDFNGQYLQIVLNAMSKQCPGEINRQDLALAVKRNFLSKLAKPIRDPNPTKYLSVWLQISNSVLMQFGINPLNLSVQQALWQNQSLQKMKDKFLESLKDGDLKIWMITAEPILKDWDGQSILEATTAQVRLSYVFPNEEQTMFFNWLKNMILRTGESPSSFVDYISNNMFGLRDYALIEDAITEKSDGTQINDVDNKLRSWMKSIDPVSFRLQDHKDDINSEDTTDSDITDNNNETKDSDNSDYAAENSNSNNANLNIDYVQNPFEQDREVQKILRDCNPIEANSLVSSILFNLMPGDFDEFYDYSLSCGRTLHLKIKAKNNFQKLVSISITDGIKSYGERSLEVQLKNTSSNRSKNKKH